MAANEDERESSPLDDLSDTQSTSSSDGETDAATPAQVEWLATSRARRSTAGNRMKSMLANEEPAAEDSDLELLFAEDENDAGFTDDDQVDASDVQMDSSSDDEDKEENGDELEGEKELQRQAREKRMAERKRKAQEAIPAKFRKKVRIEQPAARPPRPKKKSERTSWLPSPADMPTRASERQTTRISKQQLHQKMVSDELRRRKQLEKMEKKAKLLDAMKKPPMTQAERLAEAAIVEKRNLKSLNRWEEAEKQREEERMKKIAALKGRKLDGPVVTFWSGIQELQEGQSKHVGNLVSMEEKAPRKKRQSAAAALAAKEAETGLSTPATPGETSGANTLESSGLKSEQPETPAPSDTQRLPQAGPTTTDPGQETSSAVGGPAPASTPMAPTPIPPPPDTRAGSSGVLAAPVLAPPAGVSPPTLGGQMPMLGMPAGTKSVLAAPNTAHATLPLSMPPPTPPSTIPPAAPPNVAAPTASTPNPKITVPAPPLPSTPTTPLQTPHTKTQPPSAKPPDTPQDVPPSAAEPPREGKVTRSCIILQNFDDHAIKDKQVQTQILFGRRMNKLAKPAHPPLCVITNLPAKYRDPKTGLPYYNSYAYHEIQRVYRGYYKWSRLLGAWVGRGDYAARGVPEGFLDPSKVPKAAEPVLAPIDGDAEMKVEEQEQKPVADEPRLEPVEGVKGTEAAGMPAAQPVDT
ncbi:YL1 nuclear protein-domain-containing protein [Achaetomium macrosporum]|uniref:YL1 nuclear protein-domain-containing protein n=1 Tax=Achaetomium macrosporum TaxID=79813 RepID=A0AAN7HFR6_9PEZI|nr:YL1 nuclear protein-domain-containing protein [Achaetomium macrosporum]